MVRSADFQLTCSDNVRDESIDTDKVINVHNYHASSLSGSPDSRFGAGFAYPSPITIALNSLWQGKADTAMVHSSDGVLLLSAQGFRRMTGMQ
jgi:hypothetical protein